MSEVEIRKYLGFLWKWLWLVVLSTALAGGTSYLATKSMQPTYRTSIVLMVGETPANPSVRPDDMLTSQRLAAAYAGLAMGQPVLEATVQSLGLGITWRTLRERVLAVQTTAGQVIEIRVTDSDPQRAKAIADEIARQVELNSPTAEYTRQLEERRRFVEQQLDVLQASIGQAEIEVAEKKSLLAAEVSARGVMDRQDEIRALELKIGNWRATYGSLLSSYQGRSPSTVTVIEPAVVPSAPIGPNVAANVLMAAALGLLLALTAVFLFEYLSDSVSTVDDAERALGLPLVGSIPRTAKSTYPGAALVSVEAPLSASSEAYRVLCTNLQFASLDNESPTLLVTSPGPQEGKTTTAANLAVSFAQAGRRTILVDADLRKPSVHGLFSARNETGLTSLLIAQATRTADEQSARPGGATRPEERLKESDLKRRIRDYLVQTEIPELLILPSGPRPADFARVLSSARMEQVLRSLHALADVVILDSPPVLPVADTAILAARTCGVVLVVEAGRTRGRAARLAKRTLLNVRAQILGVVLNRVPRSQIGHYAYEYQEEKSKRLSLRPAANAGRLMDRQSPAGEKASLAQTLWPW